MSELSPLWSVDPTSQHVGPWGLGKVAAEVAVHEYRRAFAVDPLVAEVPDSFRQDFDRLRTMFANAALDYQLLTVVHDRAHLVLEPLVRERFLQHQGGRLQVRESGGRVRQIAIDGFDDVLSIARQFDGGRLPLVGHRPFRVGVRGLMGWARAEGYLHGQRNRVVEFAMMRLRNYAAHPTLGRRLMPRDAAIALGDLGEIANRLWGNLTPSGRLYPEPLRREPIALGVGPGRKVLHPHNCLSPLDPEPGSTWRILMAALVDEPWSFRADVERTSYPVALLAGPVGPAEVEGALNAVAGDADEVDHLDRVFWIRRRGGATNDARTGDQMLQINDPALAGEQWIPVLADHSSGAVAHCRPQPIGMEHRPGRGWCLGCGVEQLADPMSRETAREVVSGSRLGLVPMPPPRRLREDPSSKPRP